MGSQSKATNEAEYRKWLAGIGAAQLYHASYKMDGGSYSFEYNEGRLISAVSRGDGIEGEDITANALRFQGMPAVCKLPGGQLFSGFMRGEVVLLTDDWEEVDPDQLSNPRNCAVGVARRKSGEGSDLLTVYAFRLFDFEGQLVGETEEAQAKLMTEMGFKVAPYMVGTADQVWAWFQETHTKRPTLPYWIDGGVVKLNDLAQQLGLGESDQRPRGQVAVKFEAQGAESVIRAVEVTTGYTGAIVPTAQFDPVNLGGTTVTSATLCNWDNIRALGVGIGDRVRVIKAGDIIPRIMEVVTKAEGSTVFSEPDACPTCKGPVGHRVNVSGEQSTLLYCLNQHCPARLSGKIRRFLRSLDVLGVGDQLLRALITDLEVKDAADLYRLGERRDEMAALKLNGKVRLGEKRADKLLAELDKARKLTLARFLGSLGIFGLGKRRVALIQEAAQGSMEQLDDWLDGRMVQKAAELGITNTAQRFHADLLGQRDLIGKFLANGIEIIKPEPKPVLRTGAFTICITGTLSQPKAFFWNLIQTAGHAATDDFSKAVTHLVAADPSGNSGKLQKARKQGIPILSEAQLLTLLQTV